jgi:peptidoglycan-associated lipoprotein
MPIAMRCSPTDDEFVATHSVPTPRRRPLISLVAAATLALGLAACSTTDGTGGGASGTGGAGSGSGVTGSGLGGVDSRSASQFREALAREGVSDRVLFATDSSDLSAEARALVERWARLMNQYSGVKTTIEGHADERGTREYNLALGERRAVAVRNYLTSLGVRQRVDTVSYGKEKPAVVGASEASWSQNRRGVLLVE